MEAGGPRTVVSWNSPSQIVFMFSISSFSYLWRARLLTPHTARHIKRVMCSRSARARTFGGEGRAGQRAAPRKPQCRPSSMARQQQRCARKKGQPGAPCSPPPAPRARALSPVDMLRSIFKGGTIPQSQGNGLPNGLGGTGGSPMHTVGGGTGSTGLFGGGPL